MELQSEQIRIDGMSCQSCERRLQKALKSLPGVSSVRVNWEQSTAKVVWDPNIISREKIIQAVRSAGYDVREDKPKAGSNLAGIALLILVFYLLLRHSGLGRLTNVFPTAEVGMGYGMLFVIGLMTSVHCIAMCGGINLTQCMPKSANADSTTSALQPGLLYNLGRVASYTLIGGLAGALGSVISFSGAFKGIIQLLAGVFMVVMGLNMLGVVPGLRRIVPHLPASLGEQVRESAHGSGPLVIGLLNGLIPCGPLQAMQLYALSTGSITQGALSMLLFSLGTVPLMLGLSVFSSMISRRFTRRVMQVGAVLVVILGVSMFQTGLALSGIAIIPTQANGEASTSSLQGGVQYVNTKLDSGRYQPITVEAGIPVIWTITAEPGTVNGCNNRIFIPEYGIEQQLSEGDTIIEFLPESTGVFRYSCWMGMIRSTITVAEDGMAPGIESQRELEYQYPTAEFSGPVCC